MLTQLTENVFAVEVIAKDIEDSCYIQDSNPESPMISFLGNRRPVLLPPGEWQIISTVSECTEEMWRPIVEYVSLGGFGRSGEEWKNYNGKGNFRTPTESGHSLLKSKGCDTTKEYLLIKKVK